ncbi:sensor histidine kinase KdpD [Candidatus Chloroploca sp. Khr17]|uniref:sensor histidine kinase n=1 Tax=Candidatus Chloroploca sp. Khr17 TaxID=2496869 RepID=UPI00101D1D33|nr:sensor histidine kinase KdpD [Candidatus Chloroploca sp. Khr17]
MSDQSRPDPDALLARVQAEQAAATRGRLTVFFGAAPGVGKTYAMLEAAHARKAEGVDVVVGIVETHGRAETQALLDGLEVLPHQELSYHGVTLREFDLDAALARCPRLILMDELAHTNAPGTRHPKRWQDVHELLTAGIEVYTTVNVQHLESLNDVVAQITGVIVRETVPDTVVEQADEVKLIDLPTDDLLQRLREGKVYLPQNAERAMGNFFRKGNLIALRELALRRTADRVDAQMELYRRDNAISTPWPTALRLLVGISSGPSAAHLVRAARQMAAGLRAEWIVAYVETPTELRRPEAERERAVQTLRLAEQLGAETLTLSATNAAAELLSYARTRNISKIVIGKPERPRWQDMLFGSVADDLLRKSGVIDIYVLSGDFGDTEPLLRTPLQLTSPWQTYAAAPVLVAVCTLLALGVDQLGIGEANIIMLYLLGVLGVALAGGRGPSTLAAMLSVLSFNFFFVNPRSTFTVTDVRYLITFGVMLVVALVVSNLTIRFRQQAEAARQRERRTAALYVLSREFASTRGTEKLLRVAVRHIAEVFDSQVVILLPCADRMLRPWGEVSGWSEGIDPAHLFGLSGAEQGVAQWVFDHTERAGLGTDTLPSAEGLYLPLIGSRRSVGVLGVRPRQRTQLLNPEQVHLLETFASQTALALERAGLAVEAEQATLAAETERLRSALLSSVSHDLRTPLAIITGALSSLTQDGDELDRDTRADLARTACDEAERLKRLLTNLLEMTRLESGAVHVRKEWQPLEEVVGVAVAQVADGDEPSGLLPGSRPFDITLPADLPLVLLDGILIEQVLVNLLDNAVKHTPLGTPIRLAARFIPASAGQPQPAVEVSVTDRGPGLAPGDEQRVFDKFYRGGADSGRGNVGLGLAICKGMVEAHGGRIWAENQPEGGAMFRFTIPLEGHPPTVGPEATASH